MNSNDMTGDLLLEDINTGERFFLVKTKDKYRCGRSNDCDIITHSILASRKHCAFMRVDNDFNVTDLNSANGTFVNGVRYNAKVLVSLYINDLIGLGCPDVKPYAKPNPSVKSSDGEPPAKPTIYKLKHPEPQDIAKNNALINAKTEPMDTGASSSSDHKRRRSVAFSDCKIPCKIPKTEKPDEAEVICISDDSNDGIPDKNATVRKPSDPFKDANISPIKHESSWKPSISGEASTSRANDASAPLVTGNAEMSYITGGSTCFSHKEKRKSEDVDKIHRDSITKDTKVDEQHPNRTNKKQKSSNDADARGEDRSKEKRKSLPARVDSLDSRNERPNLSTSSFESSKRREEPARSTSPKDDHREEKNSFPVHIDPPDSRAERSIPAISSAQSSRRTEQAVRARSPSTSSRKDHFEEKPKSFPMRNDPPTSQVVYSNPATSSVESTIRAWPTRYASTDSSSGEDIDELRRAGLLDRRDDDLSSHSSWEFVEDFSIPGYNADPENDATKNEPEPSNDGVVDDCIKWEPELDIVDNDESFYTNENNFLQPVKPISKQLSNLEDNPPMEYSQVDYVDVCDDEEFPPSQLFGDGIIKSESKMSDDDGENEIISRRENDSPDWIELSDSEEEDNPWYNRLMRAELNMSQEVLIKQEQEEMEYTEHIREHSFDEDTLMFTPEETAPVSTLKEAAPMSPIEEDNAMFPEEEAPMSPIEENNAMFPEEAAPMSPREQPSPVSSPEHTPSLPPKKTPSILPRKETLQPSSPEETQESESDTDVEAEIFDICFSTKKNKTEKSIHDEDKDKSKKHRAKSLEKSSEKITTKKLPPKHRSIKDDSTTARSKSADSKIHHKKTFHRAMQKSPERPAESDDEEPKKSTHKSRSHKQDGKKRIHTGEREADRVVDSSSKKQDSTKERSNLRTKATIISDKITKKRDPTEETPKHRTKASTIADSTIKKRDSTEETSKHRTKTISDSSAKKRDSTEEGSNLRTKAHIIADSINKKRDSAEEKSIHRTKTSTVAESIDKKRDSEEEKSNLRNKVPTLADFIDKKRDAAEGKSNHRVASSMRSTSNPVVLLEKLDQSYYTNRTHEKTGPIVPTRKSVLLVDAPHIGHGQRRGAAVKVIDKPKNNADLAVASTSNEQHQETMENTSPRPPKLSTKEKKQLSYEEKVKQRRYLKEQRHRRIKNEWADRSLPLRKTVAFSSMSREQRDEIKNDRKERLKQIAEEKKKLKEADEEPVKRVKAKANAKVTTKSRNDYLVDEIVPPKANSTIKESAKNDQPSVVNEKSSEKPKETIQFADLRKEPSKSVDVPYKSKTIAKVTTKSRNDILVDEMLSHANVQRHSVDHRKKILEQEKQKDRSSDLRKAATPVREIPVVNRTNYSTHIKEKEKDVSVSRLQGESCAYGRKQIEQDWEEQTSIDEIPFPTPANFYTEYNIPELSPTRSTRQTANSEVPSVNSEKFPKGKRRKSHSQDSGKENAQNIVGDHSTRNLPRVKSSIILEPRREDFTFRNEHIEASKISTGVLTATTIQNSTTKISEDSELVGGSTLNNNFIYSSESTVASRDPRIKTGKPVMLKSLLRKSRLSRGNKNGVIKRVSFDDLNMRVQLFEIDPGNILKKCLFKKDAPSTKNRNAVPKFYEALSDTSSCPKLEKFLLRIFEWNPIWLEEQKKFSAPPPVVKDNELVTMLPKYESFEEYYEVAEPLLALELWHGITKDYEDENIIQKSRMVCSIVNNSVTRTLVTGMDIYVTTMLIEILVSKRDLDARIHPVFGDLIFFEYYAMSKNDSRFQLRKSFAYVTRVHQAILTPFTQFNRTLENYVKNPYMLLTYTVITKPMNPSEIQTNRISRLGTITYLRSNIRMIQGLQFLPASPLLHYILDPRVEDYQLPPPGNLEEYHLVTKDNLNTKQCEAVSRVTQAVSQQTPKICLIQGPPGTGKSKVIVNIITQILHESPNKKPMGILVCAPSNAAIDEIVLRLLDIRQKLDKGKRFKMVRIGRDQAIHPSVKEISLKELAKKNLKTKTDSWKMMDFSEENFEDEKRLLQAEKNALELELTTSKNLDPQKRKFLTRKLEDSKANYELLISRRSASNLDAKKLAKLQMIQENDLLKNADVIAGTLTSCYTHAMESIFVNGDARISVCIVDEATQSIEAETLVPLMLGVKTLVLVGDPNQLPATVLSQKAKKLGLDQSLFARIQRSLDGHDRNPIILLSTQYRMSYPVAYWPNRYFYNGALKNSANLRTLPLHFYKVIHLDSTQDINKFTNTNEANFVASMIYTIMARSNLDGAVPLVRIGIITPYNDQKALVIQKIKERIAMLPESTKKKFVYEVNTVDSFQGQERDIIIMSCVRSNGIGFLSDRQRLCVALTRARHSLFLCGNFTAFQKNPMWNALLADSRTRKNYVTMKANADVSEITRQIIRFHVQY